jgi:hypothetical protein
VQKKCRVRNGVVHHHAEIAGSNEIAYISTSTIRAVSVNSMCRGLEPSLKHKKSTLVSRNELYACENIACIRQKYDHGQIFAVPVNTPQVVGL